MNAFWSEDGSPDGDCDGDDAFHYHLRRSLQTYRQLRRFDRAAERRQCGGGDGRLDGENQHRLLRLQRQRRKRNLRHHRMRNYPKTGCYLRIVAAGDADLGWNRQRRKWRK